MVCVFAVSSIGTSICPAPPCVQRHRTAPCSASTQGAPSAFLPRTRACIQRMPAVSDFSRSHPDVNPNLASHPHTQTDSFVRSGHGHCHRVGQDNHAPHHHPRQHALRLGHHGTVRVCSCVFVCVCVVVVCAGGGGGGGGGRRGICAGSPAVRATDRRPTDRRPRLSLHFPVARSFNTSHDVPPTSTSPRSFVVRGTAYYPDQTSDSGADGWCVLIVVCVCARCRRAPARVSMCTRACVRAACGRVRAGVRVPVCSRVVCACRVCARARGRVSRLGRWPGVGDFAPTLTMLCGRRL